MSVCEYEQFLFFKAEESQILQVTLFATAAEPFSSTRVFAVGLEQDRKCYDLYPELRIVHRFQRDETEGRESSQWNQKAIICEASSERVYADWQQFQPYTLMKSLQSRVHHQADTA